jgi:hypothetical protein
MPCCSRRRHNVQQLEGKTMKIQHQVYFAESALKHACGVVYTRAHG